MVAAVLQPVQPHSEPQPQPMPQPMPGPGGQPSAVRSPLPSTAPLFALHNVTAGYDRHPAVHHLSLEVFRGDMLAVVGPNGSGKTTLLRLLAGDLRAMEGTIRLPPTAQCRVAYLPQLNRTDRSFPITVQDLVASGLWHETGALGGLDKRQRARVLEALHAVGLGACARRLIGSLSGGEFQRVRFAQLMLQDAGLVLLDEPFAGVDATTVAVLLPLLQMWQAEGVAIVAVLHELDIVQRWFPGTLLLARHMIACGDTAEVLTDANWQRAAGLPAAVREANTWCRPQTGAATPGAGTSGAASPEARTSGAGTGIGGTEGSRRGGSLA